MDDWADLRILLADGVAAARRRGRPVLVSWRTTVTTEADPVAAWSRFRARTDRTFLWSSPWSGRRLLAAGSMLDLRGRGLRRFEEVRTAWARAAEEVVTADGASPAFLGGFAFRAQPAADRSGHLPDGLLWLPAVQLTGDGPDGEVELLVNAVARPGSDPDAMHTEAVAFWRRLSLRPADRPEAEPSDNPPAPVRELPSGPSWRRMVEEAVREIRSGSFEKVVLARRVDVRSAQMFDLGAAVRNLIAHFPQSTVFATELHGRCFLGATPEYLVQVTGDEIRTLGLAGSAPRGTTSAEDARIADRLLASVKDRHEHAVVTRQLLALLARHGEDAWSEARPSVLKLANVQHLCTRLGARRGGSDLLQLVSALHPTPALGGHPSGEALRWLAANEPLDREWYAAPIGWVDTRGDGEFAVAIRSALVAGSTASLFAGCGVVADSDPLAEYRETEVKLRGMLTALGVA